MSDITLQGRLGLHKRYAPAVEPQGLHVSRGSKGGCSRVESKRGTQEYWRQRIIIDPQQNLQSAEEMEEEERAAQSAKLQELIRRGGPEDLQEANRLMKVMAGFDNRHKTDYRAKAAEEVGKIQQKARLLEERLQDFKQGDKMTEGDVFEVRPKTLLHNVIPDFPIGTRQRSAKRPP